MQRAVLGTMCALVIGVYAYTAHSGFLASTSLNAADSYYNLLVQGFRAGQLSLKKEVPPGFAHLADPLDRKANAAYGLLDLSYYKGRFYLYFGVTPAVVLFWPYVALTGHYLPHKDAGVIFCVVGFLVSVGLLYALWRRYFAEVNVAVVAAGTLALGLTTFTPLLLARCDVYEVSISCGHALTMVALAAIWKALHEPERRGWWLAAASLAYALAVGARPSLLFGAVILLVPVAQAWRERRPIGGVLAAAVGPVTLIGLGLMLYNFLRFDSPLEFGLRYQLSGRRLVMQQFLSLRYFWFNFRVYFLEPARWSALFPFVHDITVPLSPAGYGGGEHPFGVLTSIPLVWLALAVPLAWRGRSTESCSILRRFVTAVAVLFGIGTLTLCLFFSACARYEVEFLSTLVLLAVIGVLSLERALSDRPVWRRAVRSGWGLLLGFSVVFNVLASIEYCAEAHHNLGVVFVDSGRIQEGIAHYERALRLNPDYAEAHNDLGTALLQNGKVQEAIAHYEDALRIKPDLAGAQFNLGAALVQLGRVQEAIGHYEQALRIKPDFTEAHNNLGIALVRLGRVQEAISHWEQALQIKPDFAEAHCNMGTVLEQVGQMRESIKHYEEALRIKPDYAEAQNSLAWLLATLPPADGGDALRAVDLAQRACELTGDHPAGDRAVYLDTLAAAYAAAGRFSEAVATAQKAIELAGSAGQTNLVAEIKARLQLYRSGRSCRQSVGDDESKSPLTNPSHP